MIIAISILSVLILIGSYIIYNMLRKTERLEEYIEELEVSNQSYENFYSELKQRTGDMYSYIKNLDRLGSFQSDDETGVVFKEMQSIIEKLNKGF